MSEEFHRLLNLTGLLALMFMWAMSLVSHRHVFSRRQVVVSAALIPFFAVVGHGTYRAFQARAPISVDTWSMSVAIAIVLVAMIIPSHWYRDPKLKG